MKRFLALILSLTLIGDTLPPAALASPVSPAFPFNSQALAVTASSMRMPFRMPRYFYSMAAGAIAYTRTGSIAWLSVASSATLGLQLAKTLWIHRVDHPDNRVLGEPAAHLPNGVSKPDYDGSEPSRIWMPEEDGLGQREFDTFIVSDLHLRDPYMQARLHLDLLRSHRFKRLILLGDIFDEVLPNRMTPLQKEIVRHWARLPRQGVEIIYVPGNHDIRWRESARKGEHVKIHDEQGNFLITLRAVEEYTWILPDGRRLARAVHGDKYDALKSWNLWRLLEWLAGRIYDHLLDFDNWLLRERKYFTVSSLFSVTEWAKRYVGYLRRMRNKMAQLEKEEVLFHGHTHDLEMRRIKGKLVIDTGNSLNTSYSNAVGIRDDGAIEAITWKRILWKDPIPASADLPLGRLVLAGA